MINPGGGTNDIPQRLKRHFVTLNSTLPTDEGIDHIFGVLSMGHFNQIKGFPSEVSMLVQRLVPLTRKVWAKTKEKMLPTPAKFHYIFNLRDLSRMWLGMIGTQTNIVCNEEILMKLWKHEITRVISDRFINEMDKDWFNTEVQMLVKKNLGDEYEAMASDTYFVDFLRDAPEPTGEEEGDADMELPKIFEPIASFKSLEERLSYFLEQYNDILRGSNMDLVFFPDAMINLIKISRIIRNPGGNAMLVGVGGSGKQSLTKLASFIAGYKTFQVTLTRTYNTANFLEDLKLLFRSCGIQGKGTTFLFTDQDIKEEGFLEYVNNVLGGGQILNLFTRDEQSEIINECMPIMKRESSHIALTSENASAWFLERVHVNFHVVLCFSPIGEQFRSRALKFPSLISGCTINWFQPWPKEALISVSTHFLKDFEINCSQEVKKHLYNVMALVQDDVSQACVSYFERYRHTNNVTPKSFLNFIKSYKDVYSCQKDSINENNERISQGLNKLLEAAKAIEVLKIDLSKMEKGLQLSNKKSEKVLSEISQKAAEAEKIKDDISRNKEQAELIVSEIDQERQKAEDTLMVAKPALEEAENALNTIKQAHIATVRKLGKPPHLIMRIMDCVLILFRMKLPPPKLDTNGYNCFKPSWSEALRLLSHTNFLHELLTFPKDTINDETIELLEPYLNMTDYNMTTAKRVCSDVAGLLQWTRSMCIFFEINKEVIPLKLNLALEEARLLKANKELQKAERVLRKKERGVEKLQASYQEATKEKMKISKQADSCRRKMEAATSLINGLQGERFRWTQQSGTLKTELHNLVGNTMLACAFLSYSGPFNQEFRNNLMMSWKAKLKLKGIPHTDNLDIVNMLVDACETSAWALQGLPTDILSLQNAAIVTKARSYPLLIDPQGQGKMWIKSKEQYSEIQISNLNHKYFRTHLEDSLSIGRPLLIEDVGETLDPILDNLLEKNFIKQGKSLKVMLGDKEMDVVEGFYLYITTKLPNPVYSPEISARCAIIDFTVTILGLEDQLLGRVVKTEKADLELERVQLVEEIIESKATIEEMEENLLEKLNSIEGSIVDDDELITVLQNTKATSIDVNKKLQISEVTNAKINVAREEYRNVAVRGSVLYFLIVEMGQVNTMYQTSLKQFLNVFDESITKSKPDKKIEKRINNILDYLTKSTWSYTIRSLFERDKFVFTLLMTLKIDLNAGNISYHEFNVLLKGGASLNLKSVKVYYINKIPLIDMMKF